MRHQFLARAALAENQHGSVLGSHAVDQLLQVNDPRALADDSRIVHRGLRLQDDVLRPQLFGLPGAFKRRRGQREQGSQHLAAIRPHHAQYAFNLVVHM